MFPHYFVGSNADLPIVGGCILSHDHFQGGRYDLRHGQGPHARRLVSFPGFEDVEAGIVHWPMSVIRLRCADDARLVELADKILTAWRGYTRRAARSSSPRPDGEPHNTITPIARMRDGKYRAGSGAAQQHHHRRSIPLGVYHPHARAPPHQKGEHRPHRGDGPGRAAQPA